MRERFNDLAGQATDTYRSAYNTAREYPGTIAALIDVFTPEVKAAWQAAYAELSSTMLEAFTPTASPAAP